MPEEVVGAVEAGNTTVDVAGLSDEEIGKILSETDAEYVPEPEPEGDGEDERVETAAKEPTAPKPGEDAAEKPKTPEELAADVARLKKQVDDKEAYIAQRNKEIGDLRKMLGDAEAKLGGYDPATFNDKLFTDPDAALKERDEHGKAQTAVENIRRELMSRECEATVREAVPEIEALVPKIAELIVNDAPHQADFARSFQARPFDMPPTLLFNMAERARLSGQVESLSAEVARLKAESTSRADTVVRKIDEAARKPAFINGSTSGVQAGDIEPKHYSREMLTKMPREELDRLAKSLGA